LPFIGIDSKTEIVHWFELANGATISLDEEIQRGPFDQ
jgi:hypothetical protein